MTYETKKVDPSRGKMAMEYQSQLKQPGATMNCNCKRLFLSFLAVFVFIFGFDWLFHGVLLGDTYAQSATLWRSQREFMSHFHWLVLGQAVIALMLCVIYAHGFVAGGISGGIRLGILLAVLMIGLNSMTYAVQPLPLKLVLCWSVASLIEFVIAGLLVGVIYRPVGPAAPPQINPTAESQKI